MESARTFVEPTQGTILVVDDELLLQKVMLRVLRTQGYAVLTAADAFEAIAIADVFTGSIELMLIDVALPSMNGVDLALRLSQRRPHARTLFVSGVSGDAARRASRVAPLLPKPFAMAELVAKIRDVLSDGA
jgi:DNA-binding response OmpR family regulator